MRSDQKSCPVQLPLAVSGWGFKEEFSTAAVKVEKVEDAGEPMETNVEGNHALDIFTIFVSFSDNVFIIIIIFRLAQIAHCQ